ncbi:hypothetical protein Y1Q_0003862 [Alligator mississippiensis]|uniref:Uncharacterized protein n=1 Tax=Alligator mississippiensis TaxID=8496 RepID=A0A151MNZ8_ALLMI|nr:hypothetical protein Y1Q_0003862 [Alligator mississippiensis]
MPLPKSGTQLQYKASKWDKKSQVMRKDPGSFACLVQEAETQLDVMLGLEPTIKQNKPEKSYLDTWLFGSFSIELHLPSLKLIQNAITMIDD